jgi:hypothetical protein
MIKYTVKQLLLSALVIGLLFPCHSAKGQTLLDTITGFTPNLGVSNVTGAPGRNIVGGLPNFSYSVPVGYIPSQATDTPISSVSFLGYISSRDFDAGFRPSYGIAIGQQVGMFSDPPTYFDFTPTGQTISEVSRFQGSGWVQVAVTLNFAADSNLKASGGVETLVALEAGFLGQDAVGALFASERNNGIHVHGTVFKQNNATPSQGRYFTGSDLGDYLLMQVNGSGASIPEPSSVFFMLSGFLAFWFTSRLVFKIRGFTLAR